MPARFADGLDVNADGDAVQRSLLAAVPGRDLDLVLLLAVVAQLLCVPDVALGEGKESCQNSALKVAKYSRVQRLITAFTIRSASPMSQLAMSSCLTH